MKVLTICVLTLFLTASPTLASRGYPVPWRSVSFAAELPAPYGEAQVTIQRSGTSRDSRISSITIRLRGEDIEVPKELFVDLPAPRIDTAHLIYTLGTESGDFIWLYISYGEMNRHGELPAVAITLLNGKLDGRSIRMPKPRIRVSVRRNSR